MNRKFVRRCISLITVFGILLMLMLQAAATNDAVESTPQRFDPAVYDMEQAGADRQHRYLKI